MKELELITDKINKENCKAFEDYLLKEQDNIFSHADGGNVEF